MENEDFIKEIAGQLNVDEKQATDLSNEYVNSITSFLLNGENVTIPGLGAFESKTLLDNRKTVFFKSLKDKN